MPGSAAADLAIAGAASFNAAALPAPCCRRTPPTGPPSTALHFPPLQGTLLVLDEPTNHLDIPSKETLEEAVRAFEGATAGSSSAVAAFQRCLPALCCSASAITATRLCVQAVCNTASCRPNQPPRFSVPPFRCSFSGSVIAVSHDRYFLRRIATRIVTVQGGKLVDYQGDYEVGGARGHRAVRFAHCCQRSRVCLRGWIHPADVCAPSSPGRCKPTRPARCCSSCCSSSWSRTRRRRRRWRRRRRRHGR